MSTGPRRRPSPPKAGRGRTRGLRSSGRGFPEARGGGVPPSGVISFDPEIPRATTCWSVICFCSNSRRFRTTRRDMTPAAGAPRPRAVHVFRRGPRPRGAMGRPGPSTHAPAVPRCGPNAVSGEGPHARGPGSTGGEDRVLRRRGGDGRPDDVPPGGVTFPAVLSRRATSFDPRVPKATTLWSATRPCANSRCSHTTRRDMTFPGWCPIEWCDFSGPVPTDARQRCRPGRCAAASGGFFIPVSGPPVRGGPPGFGRPSR